MPPQRFVTYARVSTQQQGQSGLGLEAQRHAVTQYLGANQSAVIAEFVEVESGRKVNRPELAKALALCQGHQATLVVAKLDRLARNAAFLLTLRDSGVDFVCADMPQANRFTIGIMAVVAEAESDAISARVRDGIAAAKERGVKIGTPGNLTNRDRRKGCRIANAHRRSAAHQRIWDLTPVVRELRAAGARSHEDLANALNERGIPTASRASTA
jgi:DNA invertase Pin-like site-specific DNA recombinase